MGKSVDVAVGRGVFVAAGGAVVGVADGVIVAMGISRGAGVGVILSILHPTPPNISTIMALINFTICMEKPTLVKVVFLSHQKPIDPAHRLGGGPGKKQCFYGFACPTGQKEFMKPIF
jgi:hypothetical protein